MSSAPLALGCWSLESFLEAEIEAGTYLDDVHLTRSQTLPPDLEPSYHTHMSCQQEQGGSDEEDEDILETSPFFQAPLLLRRPTPLPPATAPKQVYGSALFRDFGTVTSSPPPLRASESIDKGWGTKENHSEAASPITPITSRSFPPSFAAVLSPAVQSITLSARTGAKTSRFFPSNTTISNVATSPSLQHTPADPRLFQFDPADPDPTPPTTPSGSHTTNILSLQINADDPPIITDYLRSITQNFRRQVIPRQPHSAPGHRRHNSDHVMHFTPIMSSAHLPNSVSAGRRKWEVWRDEDSTNTGSREAEPEDALPSRLREGQERTGQRVEAEAGDAQGVQRPGLPAVGVDGTEERRRRLAGWSYDDRSRVVLPGAAGDTNGVEAAGTGSARGQVQRNFIPPWQ